jgi:hypothetical protein
MTTMPVRLGTSFRKRSGGWGVAAAQLGYAVWFTACAAYTLARNPEVLGFGGMIVGMTAEAGLILAAFSLVASGMLLAFGYARGDLLLTIALAAGTLAALATIVATISPAGQSVLGSLLD